MDALSHEQLRACFSTLSESQKNAFRSLLTCEPPEIPNYISEIRSIELSTSLKASVEQWTKDPESFLRSTTDSPRLDSIYWRTVERHEQSELATICQRFDDFTIYTIAIESGYHNGIKWKPYGLSEFATRIKLSSPRGEFYSTGEISANLDTRVSAGCYWNKWLTALAKFDQNDKLGDEQDRTDEQGRTDEEDRTGYLIVLPQGTISEIRYTTRKISAEVRNVAAQTFVHCGITKVAKNNALFKLGQKLRKVILTGSIEAGMKSGTQNERNPSLIESPEGRTFTPASNNKRRRCNVTYSSSVVQDPFGSDFPASHAPAQNLRSPTVDVLQSTSNNELLLPNQSQAIAPTSCHTQQGTSTSAAPDAFDGQRSAEIQDASHLYEVVSQRVGNSMNHTRGTVSNDAIGPSQAEGTQITNASSASLSEARGFLASNFNSGGAQASAYHSSFIPNVNIQMSATDASTRYLDYYGAQMPATDASTPYLDYYGAQMPATDASIPYLESYGAQMPATDASAPYLESYGTQMSATDASALYLDCYGTRMSATVQLQI